LGGMTIFLFANVLVSGISVAANNLNMSSRRNKFILAVSLGFGVGVSIWPFGFQDMRASSYTANFWQCGDCSPLVKGIRNGVSIFLSTGYCSGTVLAVLLNMILPADSGVDMGDGRVVGAESEKVTANDNKKKLAAEDTQDDDGSGMEAKEEAAAVVTAATSSYSTAKNFENDEVSA
jgi:hypothetical protein